VGGFRDERLAHRHGGQGPRGVRRVGRLRRVRGLRRPRRRRSRLGLRREEPAGETDVPARVGVGVPRARPRPPRIVDRIGLLRSGRRSQGGCLQADEGRRDHGDNRAGLRSSLGRSERGRQPLHLGEEEEEEGGGGGGGGGYRDGETDVVRLSDGDDPRDDGE